MQTANCNDPRERHNLLALYRMSVLHVTAQPQIVVYVDWKLQKINNCENNHHAHARRALILGSDSDMQESTIICLHLPDLSFFSRFICPILIQIDMNGP